MSQAEDKPLVLAHLRVPAPSSSLARRSPDAEDVERDDGDDSNTRDQALVFCKSVQAASRLAYLLSELLPYTDFSSSSGLHVMAYPGGAWRSVLGAIQEGELDE